MGKYFDLPKAKIGWALLSNLINRLGKLNYQGDIIYLFDTCELVITDPKLIEHLDALEINYDLRNPENSVKFIIETK